jgi:uncharacterized repeat protein (TIGR01451 family)
MIAKVANAWVRAAAKAVMAATILSFVLAGNASAQALAPTITKSFAPSTITAGSNSVATVTVTNPNAFPISTVQFSDTMPAGIALVTQTGGTCSTLATGGGTFSINPGTGTFSSTSTVLSAGQSCTITVLVLGPTPGVFVNTTSTVTATGAPPGGPASATLTVLGLVSVTIPALGLWQLIAFATLLALLGGWASRRRVVNHR